MVQTPESLTNCLEENLWDLWSRFGLGEGCSLHEEPDALWFETPITRLPYNGVLRFQGDHDLDRRMDAIFAQFRFRGVPFFWLVHPTACVDEVVERLLVRGFDEAEVLPGMTMPLSYLPPIPDPPAGIEVREATSESDFSAVLELVAWRWEVPEDVKPLLESVTRGQPVGQPGSPIRCWVAWKDGAPVSKAILNTAAGAAGLYGVATKPEARGMGLARLLTMIVFHAGREAGETLGILHSSAMARSLYEKLGFRAMSTFRVFAPPNTLQL